MDNTCNYSDQWQPYIGDYDKFEYDIKLHDGSVIENCYPNSGLFHSYGNSSLKSFDESEVSEIRFSLKPVLMINDKEMETEITVPPPPLAILPYTLLGRDYIDFKTPTTRRYSKRVMNARLTDVRTRPKIGRNDTCPCGTGKKYKRCCGNL